MMQKQIIYVETITDDYTQETRIVVYDAGADGFGWYIDGITTDGRVFESDDDFALSLEEAIDAGKKYLQQRYIFVSSI